MPAPGMWDPACCMLPHSQVAPRAGACLGRDCASHQNSLTTTRHAPARSWQPAWRMDWLGASNSNRQA